jgi:ubiquitin-like protein Pup
MATQERGGGQQKSTGRTQEEPEVEESTASSVAERKEALDSDVDAVLGEIDEVLEENAEDFVRQFVQKGGE